MNSRDYENHLLNKALKVLEGGGGALKMDEKEANVFYFLAKTVKNSEHKEKMDLLSKESEKYFSQNPHTKMTFVQLQKEAWFLGLPRFKNMLLQRLKIIEFKKE